MANLKKIMLIDDEKDFCFFARTNLELTGEFTVITVSESLTAFDMIKQERPDLILLDIKMSGLSGPQIAQMVNSDPDLKNIPILYLTAVFRSSDGNFIDPPFGVEYLVKPISTDKLIAAIKKHLN